MLKLLLDQDGDLSIQSGASNTFHSDPTMGWSEGHRCTRFLEPVPAKQQRDKAFRSELPDNEGLSANGSAYSSEFNNFSIVLDQQNELPTPWQ